MTDASPDFLLNAPPSVTVRTVAAFVSDLRDACNMHHTVVLDIGAVAEADLSLVQAVQATRTHLDGEGGVLRLARPAGGVVAALLARAGFTSDPDHIDFWFHGELPQ
jgi:hypothetical protein